MELKSIVEKLGKLGSLEAMANFWKLGKFVVLLMLLIILGRWLPEITPGFISDHFNKGEGGIVIVDSPEVYSRERLINDRFRQVSWLEQELDESPNLAFGNQAISDLHQIMGLDTKIGNTNVNDAGKNAEGSPADSSDNENSKSERGTSVSPSERFRDIRAYREELRTEMMETLLDDRHDIKGNTLYRLKFDTTVLPDENTEKLVVIQVKLVKSKFCESLSGNDSDSKHVPCISIAAIHDSWLRQTEIKINNAIEGTIKSIKGTSLPTPDFAEFVRYLQANVSGQNNNNKDLKVKNIDAVDKLTEILSSCEGLARRADTTEETNKKIQSCPRVPVANFFTHNPDPEINARYRKLRKLLLRYYDKNLKGTKTYSNFDNIHNKFNALDYYVSSRKIRDIIVRAASDEPIDPEIGPKIRVDFEAQIEIEAEIARQINPKTRAMIVTAENEKSIDPGTRPKNETKIETEIAKHIDRKKREIIVEAEISEKILLRYAVVGLWIDKYTFANDERLENCKALYKDQLEVFDPKSLSCIAHLEKTGCNDVGYCTVRVEARMPKPRLGVICDGNVPKGDLYEYCKVREVFRKLLEINESYYSYAVTPKESAQRVLTIASERRQKQLALSLIASSANGLDPGTVSSITRAISDSATQIEQIQRRPLILSFGRGQPVVTEDKANKDRGIDFGWILGPKYLFSDRSNGEIKFHHAPVQNSLSAVISVPSWWTAIDLKIDTCWIDQDEISRLTSVQGSSSPNRRNYVKDLCDPELVRNGHKVDIDYLIRLPGSAEELPRKFGYEIERVPAISAGGILADFYVGQKKASLIIQGNELWRSTVVTMGHQKANIIEVLPNMKGIIATFNEIDIPSQKIEHDPQGERGRPRNCFVLSKIAVWTSEGRTPEGQLLARIHANPLLSSKFKPGKEGKSYPDGFGDCDRGTDEEKAAKVKAAKEKAAKAKAAKSQAELSKG
jgi:hypothetical protein